MTKVGLLLYLTFKNSKFFVNNLYMVYLRLVKKIFLCYNIKKIGRDKKCSFWNRAKCILRQYSF